jgi:hypothetical protein
MAGSYAMQASTPRPVADAGDDRDRHMRSIMRKDRLDMMLAAAGAGIGDVPAWAIMELEAYERADRAMMSGENGSGSC